MCEPYKFAVEFKVHISMPVYSWQVYIVSNIMITSNNFSFVSRYFFIFFAALVQITYLEPFLWPVFGGYSSDAVICFYNLLYVFFSSSIFVELFFWSIFDEDLTQRYYKACGWTIKNLIVQNSSGMSVSNFCLFVKLHPAGCLHPFPSS